MSQTKRTRQAPGPMKASFLGESRSSSFKTDASWEILRAKEALQHDRLYVLISVFPANPYRPANALMANIPHNRDDVCPSRRTVLKLCEA